MKTKYILVEWPESLKWASHPDCYLIHPYPYGDGPYMVCFVPENIYNLSNRQQLEMENTEFDYGHNINHKVEE